MTRDPWHPLPIPERFLHLEKVISSTRFLNKEGLGNEVPFFICPYKPQENVAMQKMVKQLAQRLTNNGVPILEINIYDLSIELLQRKRHLGPPTASGTIHQQGPAQGTAARPTGSGSPSRPRHSQTRCAKVISPYSSSPV